MNTGYTEFYTKYKNECWNYGQKFNKTHKQFQCNNLQATHRYLKAFYEDLLYRILHKI